LTAQRAILLTGCSTGIGYHGAHALKARGWLVVASCRREEDRARLAAEGLTAVRLDYADEASIAGAFAATLAATGGRLDALYNNGAYGHPSALEDLATDDLRTLFEANFIGWHDLTRRAIPVMRRQGAGRIVNCSSMLGYLAAPMAGAYIASKFALEAWSDVLRLELAGTGIAVSLIEPGPIDTRFFANARARLAATADLDRAVFRERYRTMLARGEATDPARAFRLGPEAVVRRLVHAVESRRPRPSYRITLPARGGWYAKRLLPTRLLDRLTLMVQR
jgi:NAD(P)-dependent dehydrogenase (short-subunit alcohol dehydrogenase family)